MKYWVSSFFGGIRFFVFEKILPTIWLRVLKFFVSLHR